MFPVCVLFPLWPSLDSYVWAASFWLPITDSMLADRFSKADRSEHLSRRPTSTSSSTSASLSSSSSSSFSFSSTTSSSSCSVSSCSSSTPSTSSTHYENLVSTDMLRIQQICYRYQQICWTQICYNKLICYSLQNLFLVTMTDNVTCYIRVTQVTEMLLITSYIFWRWWHLCYRCYRNTACYRFTMICNPSE